jgi:hypothetical protein
MSEVAGRMSIQVGTHYLKKELSSSCLLLSGVPEEIADIVCVGQQRRCGCSGNPPYQENESQGGVTKPLPTARLALNTFTPPSLRLKPTGGCGIVDRLRLSAGGHCAEPNDMGADQINSASTCHHRYRHRSAQMFLDTAAKQPLRSSLYQKMVLPIIASPIYRVQSHKPPISCSTTPPCLTH